MLPARATEWAMCTFTPLDRVPSPAPVASGSMPRAILFAGLALLGQVGCTGSTAQTPPARGGTTLDEVVSWDTTIQLQETLDVISVSPRVALERGGGFLVADAREAQIRTYDGAGHLLHRFGTRGRGPGEFERIAAVARLSSGEILAADMGGRLTVFDSLGRTVTRTMKSRLAPIYDISRASDGQILMTGRLTGTSSTPLVHLLDPRTGEITRSFFPQPKHPRRLAGAYTFTGFADAVQRGDTTAVLFALADSIYIVNGKGEISEIIPLPLRSYRQLTTPYPATAPPREVQAWTESFSTFSQIFWLSSDGSFLVQFFDMAGLEPQWRLARVSRDGRVIFEVPSSPRLLAVSESAPHRLYFVDPASPTPNQWAVAFLRQ